MRGALFFGTPGRSIGNDLTEFHNINAPPSLINACASICSDLQRVELIQVRFVARAAGESVSCVFVSGTIPVLVRPVITRDHLPLQPHDKRKKIPFQLWPLIYIVSRILHLTCCARPHSLPMNSRVAPRRHPPSISGRWHTWNPLLYFPPCFVKLGCSGIMKRVGIFLPQAILFFANRCPRDFKSVDCRPLGFSLFALRAISISFRAALNACTLQ